MPGSTKLYPDDPSLGLALAMVCSSIAPLLLLDGDCKVIAASLSFCEAFEIDPAATADRSLFALGEGEWDVPQLRSLMGATASGDAVILGYEMDLKPAGRPVRSLVLDVRKLAYGVSDDTRLLLAIADVTAAKAKARTDSQLLRELDLKNDALAHDNALLMQEVRHRVANSLQIIASVMMQNARRATSEETRGQLRDAHNRVMSVADLQQQLAVSTQGAVSIRAYLKKLCETIGASMIADPAALSLTVTAADIPIDAGVSVSLGLIVTELAINALKHGFPDGAGGAIEVRYEAEGEAWTLSVSDNGVGMAVASPDAADGLTTPVAGLGTSIVQALARQLGARVEVAALSPGTKVSVAHAAAEELVPSPAL